MDIPLKRSSQLYKKSGDWSKQLKKIQENFPTLTVSDLNYEPGQENELLARIQTRLNLKRFEVIDILKSYKT